MTCATSKADAKVYLKEIKQRDQSILTHVRNAHTWSITDQEYAKISEEVLDYSIGNVEDNECCVAFNKRHQFMRCKNLPRSNGLCSHHCEWVKLQRSALRKRDRCLVRYLREKLKGKCTVKPFTDLVPALGHIHEYKQCEYMLKSGGKMRQCKNRVFNQHYCKKHHLRMTAEKEKPNKTCASVQIKSPYKMNFFYHRLMGSPGSERCYCCNKTVAELRDMVKTCVAVSNVD